MTPFDVLAVPLHGVRLIEAGAGTGKTYNIEGIFLRLILEAGLLVDQIVVLTFTVAATEELRDRIRTRLVHLRTMLAGGALPRQDPLLDALAKTVSDRRGALAAVDAAVLDFDRAAVHTIHGFCHRLLSEHAVETGMLFDTELAADAAPLIAETAADFWRKHLYHAPPELAAFLFDRHMTGPEFFSALYHRIHRPGDVRIRGGFSQKPELTLLDSFRGQFAALRSAWQMDRERIEAALMDPVLKGNVYGSDAEAFPESGVTKRAVKVGALIEAMDRHMDGENIGFPLFAGFQRFTAEAVEKGTKKGSTPPMLPFFEACSRLEKTAEALGREMEDVRLWLKYEFLLTAPNRLQEHKRRKNVVFYDDLLMLVRDALKADGRLADAVGRRYGAALIDEFQDTDQVQYEICRTLFGGDRGPLFMIGDPKQAIYAFRGADVFTYLSASRQAEGRYSLTRNWRSAPALIRGVNALFSGVSRPFLLGGIPFEPAVPARVEDDAPKTSLQLCLVADDEDRPAAKTDVVWQLGRWVAEEIARLLQQGRDAGQIAVLVRTNRQAGIVQGILSQRRIPAVRYSSGSVFASPEAEQLQRLLSGVCHPLDPGRVRAALSTIFLGETAASLHAGESDPAWWPGKLSRFVEAHRVWAEGGFIRMMRRLMAREKVRRRLLRHPDGERRLTNLLHLVELCHRAESEKGMGPTALVKWLSERRGASAPEGDEAQLRLESDADAVQVVTVHRSKGLEFPIVFVPFAWSADAAPKSEELVFHDPDADNRLTLDLGGQQRERSEQLAGIEALAEDLRLLYVAVTRAVTRCYLVWGRINRTERSSLAYLFYGSAVQSDPDPVAALAARVKGLSRAEFLAPLHRLAAASKGAVEIRKIELLSEAEPIGRSTSPAELAPRRFVGAIDRSWRVTSYSHLAAASPSAFFPREAEQPDRDQPLAGAAAAAGTAAGDDILQFPGGVRAGHFFHELFETIPFSVEGGPQRRAMAARLLRQYDFDDHWQEPVCAGIERVLSAPLDADSPDLRLSAVPRRHRLHETEFFFPLKRISPGDLEALLPAAAGSPSQLGQTGARFSFSPVQGFLKGYIDLVFYHRGRYYLVDWKSNFLGPDRRHYESEALLRVMHESRYDLQYLLYCLALDLYLKKKDPKYTYETGFGGVFYLFLRGMDPTVETGPGIYRARPPASALRRLEKRLVAGEDR